MKRYTNQYRSQKWLYTVYRANDATDYILVAVMPSVGWLDIAMRLEPDEVAVLRRDEDEFTHLSNQFILGRESPKYKTRRIEARIRSVSTDEIALLDENEMEPTPCA